MFVEIRKLPNKKNKYIYLRHNFRVEEVPYPLHGIVYVAPIDTVEGKLTREGFSLNSIRALQNKEVDEEMEKGKYGKKLMRHVERLKKEGMKGWLIRKEFAPEKIRSKKIGEFPFYRPP